MATVSSLSPSTHVSSTHGAHDSDDMLRDNVQTLDRLLIKLAAEAFRQRRVGSCLCNGMRRLTHASEVALLAILMRRPLPEIRTQLGYINRQLALLAEMALRSGRGAARLHRELCTVKERVQGFSTALA